MGASLSHHASASQLMLAPTYLAPPSRPLFAPALEARGARARARRCCSTLLCRPPPTWVGLGLGLGVGLGLGLGLGIGLGLGLG